MTVSAFTAGIALVLTVILTPLVMGWWALVAGPFVFLFMWRAIEVNFNRHL